MGWSQGLASGSGLQASRSGLEASWSGLKVEALKEGFPMTPILRAESTVGLCTYNTVCVCVCVCVCGVPLIEHHCEDRVAAWPEV